MDAGAASALESMEKSLVRESSIEEFECQSGGDAEIAPADRSRWMNRRAAAHEAYVPTGCEHVANVITHGIAIPPALYAFWMTLDEAASQQQYTYSLVYGVAVAALFTMSCLYHSVFFIGKWKWLRLYLHIIDRATIYIFIAASYSPWLNLKDLQTGLLGTEMRWLVWMFALCGIAYQYCFHERYKLIEALLYLFVGFFPAVAIFYMREWSGIGLLALGGLTYMVGMVFFKCDGRIPCAHAIWHVHVVIGAFLHYYAVSVHLIGPEHVSENDELLSSALDRNAAMLTHVEL